MIFGTWILAGSLMALQKPADKAAPATAAEQITLRDGSVVMGLVTGVSNGPRGAVELLVQRNWAEKHLKKWASKWSRAIEAGSRLASRQRRERLGAWKRERAASASTDDRIVAWIDQELKRLDDPDRTARTRSDAGASLPGRGPGPGRDSRPRTHGCFSLAGCAVCPTSRPCGWTI